MKCVCLRLYTYERQKHRGTVLYEWLLEFAKKEGIHGGTAFRGIAGYGRHTKMHEEHFFELGADVPVEVMFILSSQECRSFLVKLAQEKLDLFYAMTDVECGSLAHSELEQPTN